MVAYVQGKLDRLVEKMISRKFLVWLTATGLLAFSDLQSGDWVIISAIYIGGQSVIDAVKAMKGSTNVTTKVETAVKTILSDKDKKDEKGKVPLSDTTGDTVTK